MTTTLDWAKAYQAHGFRVLPLVVGTRSPLKGLHLDEDATTDPAQATKWWADAPDRNVGLWLKDSGVLMFDVDTGHASGTDGMEMLRKLAGTKTIGALPGTYFETSPNGGLHLFYSYPTNLTLTSGENLWADAETPRTGLDYTTRMVPVAPSRYNGGACVPADDKKWDDIAPAPEWLLAEITKKKPRAFTTNFNRQPQSWTGELLDKIVTGTDSGDRNAWLASITGALIHTGMGVDNMVALINTVNRSYIRPPLRDREVMTIVDSIARREAAKMA